MATPRTQQENPEAAYAATRDKAIETFIQDPTYGKGVSVRKAGAGTREFTFAGGSVYTWSADQEKADREADTSVDSNKTFAEILTTELPSRLAVAERLWAEGGDEAGARAELDALDRFARENRDTLRTLTRYQGRDELARGVADQARGLVSGAYRLKFATMGQDQEIKAKVAQKRALDMGLDAESADVYTRMTAGHDPEAIALWNAAGGPANAEPKPGSAGRGATPQAARAAAAGIDLAGIKGFISYAKTAGAKLAGNIEKPVLDLMSPDDRAKALRVSYDSGDKESGGIVLGTAARVARAADGGADGRGKLNAFQSALVASNEAMQAWGDAGDPVRRAMGVKIMASLADSLPGTAFVSQKQQVADTLKMVSASLEQNKNAGVDFDDKTAATFARVSYNRKYRPSVAMVGDEARMSDTMTKAFRYSGNITVSTRAVDPRSQTVADDTGGYTLLAGVLRDHVRGAAAAAMANGTVVEKEMLNRSAGLAQMLQSLGVPDKDGALNAARLLSQAIVSGEEIDVSRISQILGQDDIIRKMVEQANGKKVATGAAATVPDVNAATGEDALFNKAMGAALAAEEARDKASGETRTREERVAAAKVAANNNPNIKFVQVVEGFKVEPQFTLDKRVARGLRWGLHGEPYTPKPVRKVAEDIQEVVPDLVFESSPMFRYLYDSVNVNDLDSDDTRAAAVALFMNTYAARKDVASRMSNVAALSEVANAQVSRIIDNIKIEVDRAGIKDGAFKPSYIFGSDNAGLQKRVARTYVNSETGPGAEYASKALQVSSAQGFRDAVKEMDVALSLARAIFDGADTRNDNELVLFAKRKLADVTTLPPKAAPADKKTVGGGLTFNLVALGESDKVWSGYTALAKLDQKLGRPIEDSAVRKLAFVDLPNLMSDLPDSKKARGYRVINEMLEKGVDSDAMLKAFEDSLATDERRAAEAKRVDDAEKIRMRAQASGAGVFGTPADEEETAPGTK